MKAFKNIGYSSIIIGLSAMLLACFPPAFYSTVSNIALDGNDVDFFVKVSNAPTSVTCFDGNVTLTLSATEAETYEGTVGASLLSVGSNKVRCTATNNNGAATADIGAIIVVENVPPTLATYTPITADDNDGTVAINEVLVDTASSTYIDYAQYSLSVSSDALPAGLSIDANNGNLVGSVDINECPNTFWTSTNVIVTAETLAGTDDSDPITVTINDSSVCP